MPQRSADRASDAGTGHLQTCPDAAAGLGSEGARGGLAKPHARDGRHGQRRIACGGCGRFAMARHHATARPSGLPADSCPHSRRLRNPGGRGPAGDARRMQGARNDLSLPEAGYLWSDYYASADPVSNGPLPRREEADPGKLLPAPCEEVFNSGSVFFDHNGYLRNHDELLPRLINDLVRAASEEPTGSDGFQLVSKEHIDASRDRRLRLVRFLIGARILTVVLFVTTWWGGPYSAMRRPLDWLTRLLSAHGQMDSGTIRLVGALIITAAFYALAVTIWRVMIGQSAGRFFRTAAGGAEPRPRDLESASAPTTAHRIPGAAH